MIMKCFLVQHTVEGDSMHFALFAEAESISFEQGLQDSNLVAGMKEELKSMEKNQTQELVFLPHQKRSIVVNQVYKVKIEKDDETHKPRKG